MTWALVTGATGGHDELLRVSLPTMKAYADRWGMDLVQADLTGGLPPSWFKIPAMIHELETHDGVLWVDADAVFLRYDVWIGDCCTKPWNWVINEYTLRPGMDMVVPSCGVFAVKSEGRHLLELVWEKRNEYASAPWWEQSAAHDLFGWGSGVWNAETPYSGLAGTLPRAWNSQAHDPADDPIVFHAAGLAMGERKRLMKAQLA